MILAIIAVESNPYIDITKASGGVPVNVLSILWIITIPLAVFGVLSIIGGIYALQGKEWGLALTGSIAAALPLSLVGIAAFIITVLTKNEYE